MIPTEDAYTSRDRDPGTGEILDSRATVLTMNDTPEKPDAPVATPLVSPTPLAATEELNANGQDATTSGGGDELLTKIFQFLSTATPESLGAIGVGLAAVTYFILGSVGVLLIGAFAGVSAFISWEARNPHVTLAVRGEKGTDALSRILDFKEDLRKSNTDLSGLDEDDTTSLRSFEDFQPETRDALNNLVDAVVRDYVKWWYGPIVPADKTFPLACRKVLTSFLLSVFNRLSKKRPADTFLDFLTNSSSIVIVFFSELSTALADQPSGTTSSTTDAIYNYLASNPDSNLANLLNKKQQAAKFRMAAEDLLQFLDRPTYDCDPARVFLREILAGVIFEMTLGSCSRAEWINGWIVFLLEAGEPDFNQAIDVGMQTGSDAKALAGAVGNNNNGNRNSVDADNGRKDSSSHKKKPRTADEEMEEAMEEMKKLNQMIAEEDARRKRQSMTVEQMESKSSAEASSRLADAIKRNADTLDMHSDITNDGPGKLGAEALSPTSMYPPPSREMSGDDMSGRSESGQSILTPRSSEMETPSQPPSPVREEKSAAQFTSFDQLVPPAQDDGDLSDSEPARPPPLTLHNAVISIHDDGAADGKSKIKNKPTGDYWIQVEPATSHYPGWMIVRKYADFEKLHEVLARIAKISGATAFTEQHSALPSWRLHTKVSLRGELERYCRDACQNRALADSEGMKRFLEKDVTHTRAHSKTGFEAFGDMGKNVLGVLTSAPKGMAEGGKVVVGGVTGVLGNIGLGSRKNTSSSLQQPQGDTSAATTPAPVTKRHSMHAFTSSSPARVESNLSVNSGIRGRDSLDSQRSSVISTQPGKVAPMERRPSYNSLQGDGDGASGDCSSLQPRPDRTSPTSARGSRNHSRASSMAPLRSPSSTSLSGIKLPPLPDDMPDDYGTSAAGSKAASIHENKAAPAAATPTTPSRPLSVNGFGREPTRVPRQFAPLSEQEVSVAVELMFAVITEMYTLSPSAWNIRRTLLAAAKSFLLRPGNPSLESIRTMMQESVLDAASSDEGVARQLRKIRENSLPTEEELATWPAEMSEEAKENLRVKARKLLIQSGVPAALSGVMGQAATAEALGRVFDCLQVEEVARGLLFGIMLQAVRAITH